MTDRLSLTNALADADIDRQKAERIATEIFDAIHEHVATKADVERLETRLEQVNQGLRSEMRELELRLDQVHQGLRSEMRELELRLEARIDRIVVRLGSLIVVLAGVILAAIRYLPRS